MSTAALIWTVIGAVVFCVVGPVVACLLCGFGGLIAGVSSVPTPTP